MMIATKMWKEFFVFSFNKEYLTFVCESNESNRIDILVVHQIMLCVCDDDKKDRC